MSSSEWQGFYSASQASRLSGVPIRTLYAWNFRRVIGPSVQVIGPEGLIEQGYSYGDLAIIKLMRGLRNKQLNTRSVARALRHLYERFGPPTSPNWQQAHVYVFRKEVYAQKPDEWDTTVATLHGQQAMVLLLGELIEEEAALLVPRGFAAHVEINPEVMEGQPVIRDTRVPTSLLVSMYDEGTSLDLLAKLYHPLSKLAISKGIEFEQWLDRAAQRSPTKTGTLVA